MSQLEKIFNHPDSWLRSGQNKIEFSGSDVDLEEGKEYYVTSSLKNGGKEEEDVPLPKFSYFQESNQILEGLWLGDYIAMTNHKELIKNQISHILSVTTGATKDPKQNFQHSTIEVEDFNSTDLSIHFEPSDELIQKARFESMEENRRGGILVHCMQGMSRSATIVLAYVMKTLGLTLDEATLLVKCARPMIWPNDGFEAQLIAYDLKLREERENENL